MPASASTPRLRSEPSIRFPPDHYECGANSTAMAHRFMRRGFTARHTGPAVRPLQRPSPRACTVALRTMTRPSPNAQQRSAASLATRSDLPASRDPQSRHRSYAHGRAYIMAHRSQCHRIAPPEPRPRAWAAHRRQRHGPMLRGCRACTSHSSTALSVARTAPSRPCAIVRDMPCTHHLFFWLWALSCVYGRLTHIMIALDASFTAPRAW